MTELKRTPLTGAHERLGARMVPYAGFLMPVQYESITEEHRAVRERAGLFDVSHMGEFVFSGPGALEGVQRVTVNDAGALAVDQAQYSALVDEKGGIVDDCVVCRLDRERFLMVVNAANIEKDVEHVRRLAPGAGLEDRSEEFSLIALQGPRAETILGTLTGLDLGSIDFYWKRDGEVAGVPAIVSRTGYTGEDGFELCVEAPASEGLWEALLEAGREHGLRPCGLGARDTLRLEMKYALYGNDIDETTNPYEAGLGWIVKPEKGEFVGRDALAAIKERGPDRRLVGFRVLERGFPRPGYVVALEGEEVDRVRSGTMSPTLGYGIGTTYLPRARSAAGTALEIDIRGRPVPAVVVKTPFYAHGSLKR
ncbi:MAG TPA: glycine cleavage system aminomethyltransferase GcvT [Gemmatimonadota bacterium]|nr:glycine cleavage system aminomethyltransferase GcvT [Gemmatimonadota bacterium]